MPESYAGSGIRESLGFGRGACDGCYLSQEPDERLYGLRFLLPRCPLRADALVYGQAREQESGFPYIYEEEWSACLSNP